MFAIFTIGNKQYYVQPNETIYVDKLACEVGQKVVFDKVLMVDDKIGYPYLPLAKVVCEVVKHGKQRKLIIIKHLPQKHHTHKTGHRQQYTQLLIKEIVA